MIATLIIVAIIIGCAGYLFLGFYSSEDDDRTGTGVTSRDHKPGSDGRSR